MNNDNQNDWQRDYNVSIGHHERNDFFEVVPPTPFDFAHGPFHHLANSQSPYETERENENQVSNDYHLQPNASRGHRSSSTGSISSQISGYSGSTNLTQWGSDTGTDHSELASTSFPGLSVDPKLFQAKPKTPIPEAAEKVEILVEPIPSSTTKGKKRVRATSQKEKEDKKKISHARKAQQHPEHIPRPRNAFILFRKYVVDSKLIPTSVEIRHQNVSIITAKMWSEASAEQKAHFAELATIEKEEHLIKYPGYRYQPVYRRTNVVRRRVRKDAAEEEKCKSVAQLLMQGKTGEELAEEIKENGTKNTSKAARAPSKKGQANELSKGALRALRAQARQSGSAEGSEMSMSRSVSRVVSPEPMVEEDDSEDSDSGELPLLYMPENVSQPILVPDQSYGQPRMAWGYEQPVPHGQQYVQHGFQYPQHQVQMPEYESYTPQNPPQFHLHETMYPNPIQSYEPLPDFYTHDQALPFSPSATSFSQVHAHPQPSQAIYRGMREGVNDMVFSTFPDVQSPTMAYGTGMGGPSRPMSARWGGFDMGEDTFGLGFSEHDMMLNEYGSALAQVDDTSVW